MNLFRVPIVIVMILLIAGSSCQHTGGYGTKAGVGYFWRNADPDVEYTLYVNELIQYQRVKMLGRNEVWH
jgi:hypothetical protein